MLNEQKLISGLTKTIENAASLFNDATLLTENERYARAYTLFQLSIEEAGKSLILYNCILEFFQGKEIDKNHLDKKGYRDHKSKTKESLKLELTALLLFRDSGNGNDISDLLDELVKDSKSINQKNNQKNASLYVSLIGSNFIAPNESISKSDVSKIAETALIRLKLIEAYSKEVLNNLDRTKKLADGLKNIENDPKLELEYKEKINKWINE